MASILSNCIVKEFDFTGINPLITFKHPFAIPFNLYERINKSLLLTHDEIDHLNKLIRLLEKISTLSDYCSIHIFSRNGDKIKYYIEIENKFIAANRPRLFVQYKPELFQTQWTKYMISVVIIVIGTYLCFIR